MLGIPLEEGAEDLSDAGVAEWVQSVLSFKNQMNQLQSSTESPIDDVVLRELGRFLDEQKIYNIVLDTYRTRFSSTLRLLLFSLLPLLIPDGTDDDPEKDSGTRARILAAQTWLSHARDRYDGGVLLVSSADRTRSRELALSLSDRLLRYGNAGEVLLQSLHDFAKVEQLPARSANKSAGLNGNAYLEHLLGGAEPTSHWIDRLMEDAYEFAKTLRVYDAHENSSATTQPDYLSWARAMKDELTVVAASMGLSQSNQVKAKIVYTPPPLVNVVTDAMFYPMSARYDGEVKRNNFMFIPREPAEPNPGAQTWARAGLAVAVAHELIPGHALHHRYGLSASFGDLFTITRSPIGSEGWATFSERTVDNLDERVPMVKMYVRVQQLRRTATAVYQLSRLAHGSQAAEERLASVLQKVPARVAALLARSRIRQPGLGLLKYAIGHHETSRVIASIQSNQRQAKGCRTAIEDFVSLGPISPRDAATVLDVN